MYGNKRIIGRILAVALFLVLPLVYANFEAIIYYYFVVIVFTIFGTCVAHTVLDDSTSIEEKIIIGFILGLGINFFFIILFSKLSINDPWLVLIINVMASVLIIFKTLRKHGSCYEKTILKSANCQHIFSTELLSVLVIIFFILGIAFVGFGKMTLNGYMYKDLYATDLLHHMSLIPELQKKIPPENIYYSGETLHYYWLAHLLPSYIYSINSVLEPRDLILLCNYVYALVFMIFLILFLRCHFGNDRLLMLLLVVLSMFAYSYKDIYVVFKYALNYLPERVIDYLHLKPLVIDEYGHTYTNYSHGWFRSFMVEPQCTLAISIIMASVLIIFKYGNVPRNFKIRLLQGFLLGVNLGIDAFMGLMFLAIYSVNTIYGLVSTGGYKKQFSENSIPIIQIYLPIGFMMLICYFLDIFKLGESYLTIQPFYKMLLLFAPYFILDYGPMGIFAIIWLVTCVKKRGIEELSNFRFYIVLMIVSMIFIFFVNYKDIGSTQIFRKGGYILRIGLIILSGKFLKTVIENYRTEKLSFQPILVALAIFLSAPNLILDAYFINKFEAKTQTYFVSPEAMKAYQWIKNNTNREDVVQERPGEITPIVAFAERRTCLGDWEHARVYQIGLERVAERHKIIIDLFSEKEIGMIKTIMDNLNINYLLFHNTPGESIHECIKGWNDIFKKVYDDGHVSVYKYLKR